MPFALVFYLCRGYFPGWPDADDARGLRRCRWCMSFLLGFFLEATIGMIGFWFLEVSSLLFVYMLFKFFLLRPHVSARHAARRPGGTIVDVMPLQYLAYFPAAVFLGKIQGAALVARTGASKLPGSCSSSSPAAWSFHCGVKRYSGIWRIA